MTNDYKVVRVIYDDFPRGRCYKIWPEVGVYELSTRSWRYVNSRDFLYVVSERCQQAFLNELQRRYALVSTAQAID
ncbi:hypothetical protein LguiB_018338 [Lonicera macranthoides]